VRILIAYAYRLRDVQVIGGPARMDADLWEVQAKAQEGTVTNSLPTTDNATPDAIHLMLQSVLQDRFQLKFHKEMHSMCGNWLEVSR
jgi:uncharacterized protein (TIGR03435 family)